MSREEINWRHDIIMAHAISSAHSMGTGCRSQLSVVHVRTDRRPHSEQVWVPCYIECTPLLCKVGSAKEHWSLQMYVLWLQYVNKEPVSIFLPPNRLRNIAPKVRSNRSSSNGLKNYCTPQFIVIIQSTSPAHPQKLKITFMRGQFTCSIGEEMRDYAPPTTRDKGAGTTSEVEVLGESQQADGLLTTCLFNV